MSRAVERLTATRPMATRLTATRPMATRLTATRPMATRLTAMRRAGFPAAARPVATDPRRPLRAATCRTGTLPLAAVMARDPALPRQVASCRAGSSRLPPRHRAANRLTVNRPTANRRSASSRLRLRMAIGAPPHRLARHPAATNRAALRRAGEQPGASPAATAREVPLRRVAMTSRCSAHAGRPGRVRPSRRRERRDRLRAPLGGSAVARSAGPDRRGEPEAGGAGTRRRRAARPEETQVSARGAARTMVLPPRALSD